MFLVASCGGRQNQDGGKRSERRQSAVSTDPYCKHRLILAIYELGNDIFNSKVFINKFFSFKICGSSHFVAFKDI